MLCHIRLYRVFINFCLLARARERRGTGFCLVILFRNREATNSNWIENSTSFLLILLSLALPFESSAGISRP